MIIYSLTWATLWIFGYHGVICQSLQSSEISISPSYEATPFTSKGIPIDPSFVTSQSRITTFTSAVMTDFHSSTDMVESGYITSEGANSIQSSYGISFLTKSVQIIGTSSFGTKDIIQMDTEYLGTSSSLTVNGLKTGSTLTMSSGFMTPIESDNFSDFTTIHSEEMFTETCSFHPELTDNIMTYSLSQQAHSLSSNVMSDTKTAYGSYETNEYSQPSKYNSELDSLYGNLLSSAIIHTTIYTIEPSPAEINESFTSAISSDAINSTISYLTNTYPSDIHISQSLFDTQTITTSIDESVTSQTIPVLTNRHSVPSTTTLILHSSTYNDLPNGSLDQSQFTSDILQHSDISSNITSATVMSHMTDEQLYPTSSFYTKELSKTVAVLSVFHSNSVALTSSSLLTNIDSSYISEKSVHGSPVFLKFTSTFYSEIEITSLSNIEAISSTFSTGFVLQVFSPSISTNILETETEIINTENSESLDTVVLSTTITTPDFLLVSSSELEMSRINETNTYMTDSSLTQSPMDSDIMFPTFNLSSTYFPISTLVPSSTRHSTRGSTSPVYITAISSKYMYNETIFDSPYSSVTQSISQRVTTSSSETLSPVVVPSSNIDSFASSISSTSQVYSMLVSSLAGLTQTTVFTSLAVSEISVFPTPVNSEQIKSSAQSSSILNTQTLLPTMLSVDSSSVMDSSLLNSIDSTSSFMLSSSIVETTIANISGLSEEIILPPPSSIQSLNTSDLVSSYINNASASSSDLLEITEYFSTHSINSDVQFDSSNIHSVSSDLFTDLQTFITTTSRSKETYSDFEPNNSVIESASHISRITVTNIMATDMLSSLNLQPTEFSEQSVVLSKSIISPSTSSSYLVPFTSTIQETLSSLILPFKSPSLTESSFSETVDQTQVSSIISSTAIYVDYSSQIFSSKMGSNADQSPFTSALESPTISTTTSSTVSPASITSQIYSSISVLSNEYPTLNQYTSVTLTYSTDLSVMSTADISEVITVTLQTTPLSVLTESSSLLLTTDIFPSNTIDTEVTSLEIRYTTNILTEQLLSLSSYTEISSTITSINQTVDHSSIRSIAIYTSSPIAVENSSDVSSPSLDISSITFTSSTNQLVTETTGPKASASPSTTPGSTETTPKTPDQSSNITNADESFWVKSVLSVRKTTDISSESFRTDLEQRLAEAYSEAFQRESLVQQGLFENLRRKRYVNNGEASVHIHDVSRDGDTTSVNVVYAVEKSGTRLRPSEAVTSLNSLSTQELAIILRQVVQTVAEPYQSATQPTNTEDGDGISLWLVAAITGSVGGFIILVWLFVCVYIKCCREKKEMEKHVEPELTSIPQNDASREVPRRQTESNGVGTSTRKSLPHQTSKSSLTKKSTAYQINQSDEEALIETMAEPDVEEYVFENKVVTQASSPPTKRNPPRIRSPEKQLGTGSTTSLSHKHDMEPHTSTKKGKRSSKLGGTDGSIPGMDYPDSTNQPHLLKYQVLQSSFSDQDNEDLRERMLLERQKNKERTRHKRRKPRHKDEVHPTSVLYSTMGIPSTPLPSVQVESGSPVREHNRRNTLNTLDGGVSTENLSGDESLQEARTRMHRLLDDAFSLISPRASFTENNFPRENGSHPYINKDDDLPHRPQSGESLEKNEEQTIKHEPMYVNPFYSESSFPLETWSPYRTSDLVAMISMPSKQEPTRLGQKPKSATRPMSSKPNRRPAANFDFSETKSATTFDDDRFTTNPAKPIVIRTKPVIENGSANSNKQSNTRIPSGRTTVMVSPLPKSNQNEQFEMNSLSKGTLRNGSAGKYKSRSLDRSNVDEVDVIHDIDADQSSDKLIKSLRDELGELKELYSVPNTRIERKKNRKNINSSNTEAV